MTFDPTKPVQQRNGRPAEIIATGRKLWPSGKCIVAEIADRDGDRQIGTFASDGRSSSWGETDYDLINIPLKPRKVTVWLNRYPAYRKHRTVVGHTTKEEADSHASDDRIGEAVPYEYEVPGDE